MNSCFSNFTCRNKEELKAYKPRMKLSEYYPSRNKEELKVRNPSRLFSSTSVEIRKNWKPTNLLGVVNERGRNKEELKDR